MARLKPDSPIILYSHGFGVRQDDRGLFTEIAQQLPGYRHIMFDYNQVDEDGRSLTVGSLIDQAKLLEQTCNSLKATYPKALIYLVAHSQGCVVAALAKLTGLTAAILLAPPSSISYDRMRTIFEQGRNSRFSRNSISTLERSDRSTTTVLPTYWVSLDNLDVPGAISQLAQHTRTLLVEASQDEILGLQDFTTLYPGINRQILVADHNFTGSARQLTADLIQSFLQAQPVLANATNTNQEFNGVKGTIFIGEQVLVYRRSPDIARHPNELDLSGGGREGRESPIETLCREAKEEFNLDLHDKIVYSRSYPVFARDGRIWYFMVAKLPTEAAQHIGAGSTPLNDVAPGYESQHYQLMNPNEYLAATDAWADYQQCTKDYLVYQETSHETPTR
ncbi:MAG TPA: NUDIX domain-containing protein [Candidatus Saccharimonadia bacterium]